MNLAPLLLLSIVATLACTSGNPMQHENFNCGKSLFKKDVIFLHGGILDKYDKGRVFVSIQRVHDPKNWGANEYFTGKRFSKNEKGLLKVPERDSCELKRKYFKFIKAE